MTWALARLAFLLPKLDCGVRPAPLLQLTLQRALEVGLDRFPGRDLPLIVWGAAMLHRGLKAEGESGIFRIGVELRASLLRALGGPNVVLRLPEVPAQNLAMLLWVLAVLNGNETVPSTFISSSMAHVAADVTFPGLLFAAAGEEAELRAKE